MLVEEISRKQSNYTNGSHPDRSGTIEYQSVPTSAAIGKGNIPKPRNIPRRIMVRPQKDTIDRSRISKGIDQTNSHSSLFGGKANDVCYPHEDQR
jgi:hypothetical protein